MVYLSAIFIPHDHRANVFLTVPIIKYLRSLAWVWGVRQELFSEEGLIGTADAVITQWNRSFDERNAAFGVSYFARNKTQLMEAVFCILEDMADPMSIPSSALQIHRPPPDDMCAMPLTHFFTKILCHFPGGEHL